MHNDNPMRLRSVDDAARLLGVSTKTMRRLISSRKLPSVRIGRRVLIPSDSLAEFVRSNTQFAIDAERLAASILRF